MLFRNFFVFPLALLCLTLVENFVVLAMENEEGGSLQSKSLLRTTFSSSSSSFSNSSYKLKSSTTTPIPQFGECPDSMFPDKHEDGEEDSQSPVILDELYSSYYEFKSRQEDSDTDESSDHIVLVTPPITTPVMTPVPAPRTTTTTTTTPITTTPITTTPITTTPTTTTTFSPTESPKFPLDDIIVPVSPIDESFLYSPQTEDSKQFKECMGQDCMELASLSPKVNNLVNVFEHKPSTVVQPRRDYSRSEVAKLINTFERFDDGDQFEPKVTSPTLTALREGTLDYLELPKKLELEVPRFVPTKEFVPNIVSKFESLRSEKPAYEVNDEYVATSVVEVADSSPEQRLESKVTREAVPKLIGAWEKLRKDSEQVSLHGRRTGYTFKEFCDDKIKKCSNVKLEKAPLIEGVAFPSVDYNIVSAEPRKKYKIKIRATSGDPESAKEELKANARKLGVDLEDQEIKVSSLRGYRLVEN
ncbi:secreted mucin like glycoprotein [Cryptosporidium sp. chipmunk genotype I]|uniref:secreted mucin like glycoprotein n=1 Tax=Cryptosporidium sp. chipmunk genotype I TaxID=1280935 RepID=UPI003519F011|nr:secreted mucin like glycoprotein [Cryptosporidium sp. chipmunk genotype I]